MNATDIAQAAASFAAVTGGLGALFLQRRAGHVTERNADAASILAQRTQSFSETKDYTDRLERENARLVAERDREADQNEALRARLADCDEQWHVRFSRRDARCREALENVSAALSRLMTSASLSDRASAEQAIVRADEHMSTEHN